MKLTLPTDSNERKNVPVFSGCVAYFPAALAGVAAHSKRGNDKHNPGEELHHARGKSSDHADCIQRHLIDLADLQAHQLLFSDEQKRAILDEANALCWRALALSQELHEEFGAPLAPAARIPGKVGCMPELAAGYEKYPYPQGSCRVKPASKPEPRLHTSWCAMDTDHSGACRGADGFTSPPAGQAGRVSSPDQNAAQSLIAQPGHTPALNQPSPLCQPPAPGVAPGPLYGPKHPL